MNTHHRSATTHVAILAILCCFAAVVRECNAKRHVEATVPGTGEVIFSDHHSRALPVGIIDPKTHATYSAETMMITVRRGTTRRQLEDELHVHGMQLRKHLSHHDGDEDVDSDDANDNHRARQMAGSGAGNDTYLVEFQETSSVLAKNLVAAQLNGLLPSDGAISKAKQLVERNCNGGRHVATLDETASEQVLEQLQAYNSRAGHKSFYQWSQALYATGTPNVMALTSRVRSHRLCNITWENVLWIPTTAELTEYAGEMTATPASERQILAVEKNIAYDLNGLTFVPNDPILSAHLGRIKAYQAWDTTFGSTGIVVGVIDSGVMFAHEDLVGKFWTNPGEIAANGIDDDFNGFIDDVKGWDFVNNDNLPEDDFTGVFHGTHVAGIIGATINNAKGVAGVSPSVRLMTLKTFDSTGSGLTSDIIAAIYYAIANGARLTSNSYGGAGFSASFQTAIAASQTADMLFVAAAGNAGSNNDATPFYPASYTLNNVIAVAASISVSSFGTIDRLTSFSNFGATSVDLAAPGDAVFSTINDGSGGSTYASYAGTSMATPQVSAAIVLAATVHPSFTYLQLRQLIFDGVDPLTSPDGPKVATHGRLNVLNVVAPSPPPPSSSSKSTTTSVTPPSSASPTTTTTSGKFLSPFGVIFLSFFY